MYICFPALFLWAKSAVENSQVSTTAANATNELKLAVGSAGESSSALGKLLQPPKWEEQYVLLALGCLCWQGSRSSQAGRGSSL